MRVSCAANALKVLFLTLIIFRATAAQLSEFPGGRSESVLPASSRGSSGSSKELPCPKGRDQTAEAHFGDYTIRTFRWPEPEGCAQILREGKVIRSLTGGMVYEIGGFYKAPHIPIGTDVTGSGKPDAIIGEWSGGAHCCFTLYVFQIGDKFKEIGQIHADHSDRANFADLNRDGHYEFVGSDWAFAYWGTSFMDSPAPKVILTYGNRRFSLAYDLMRKPGPTSQEFTKLVKDVGSDKNWNPGAGSDCLEGCGAPLSLWKNMLELMYTGHPDLGWQLLDRSWPSQQKGKPVFIRQFCKQLRSSHYWHDLKNTIGQCPPTV